jgi:C4-dicarboxylate-specific signal transduction histidine kinase
MKQAEEFSFQFDAYLQALEEVPVVEESRIPAIMGFLVHFAQLVASMGLEKLRALEVEEQSRQRLEDQVEKRTFELKQQAKDLQQEIAERKKVEAEKEQFYTFFQTASDIW